MGGKWGGHSVYFDNLIAELTCPSLHFFFGSHPNSNTRQSQSVKFIDNDDDADSGYLIFTKATQELQPSNYLRSGWFLPPQSNPPSRGELRAIYELTSAVQ